jgi:Stage II sporulation protein E (SpoIIE)
VTDRQTAIDRGIDTAVAMRRVVQELLLTSREVPPAAAVDGVRTAAAALGASGIDIYLNDYEQRDLRSLEDDEPLNIDGTVAGRTFTSGTRMETCSDGVTTVWLPLVNGASRLGVMRLTFADLDDDIRDACDQFAALVAELVVCRDQYTDTFVRARRGEEMSLAAEMCWNLLRPLTFNISALAASAMLQPAYDVGGDVFDYACNAPLFHAVLFDAMGHGVGAALTSTVAVGAYRYARRRGDDLAATYHAVDQAIDEHRAGTFATGVLAELDWTTGSFSWLNAGHPAPMLIRDRAVQRLGSEPALPMGFATAFADGVVEVATTRLQDGDRVLLFSDGCTEARTPSGEAFGEVRLGDFLIREQSAGLELAETLRRLSHAVVEHAGGDLADDATVVLLEYRAQS